MNDETKVYRDDELKQLGEQLRKPVGDLGLEVARKMNEGNERINRYALDALVSRPGDRVLEIGMGNGFFCKDVLSMESGVTYVGCDYSKDMVVASSELNNEFVVAGRAEFVIGDVVDLPFEDNSFDIVFSVNTVYFWDTARAFADILRVLKPKGSIVIALRPRRVMQLYPFVKGFNMYSSDELSTTMENAGFTVTDIEEHDEPDTEFNGCAISIATLVVKADAVLKLK